MSTPLHPSYRLFLFGVDLTDDVDQYSVTWADSRSPSTLNVVLANPNNKYTITLSDMEAIYDAVDLSEITPPSVAVQSAAGRASAALRRMSVLQPSQTTLADGTLLGTPVDADAERAALNAVGDDASALIEMQSYAQSVFGRVSARVSEDIADETKRAVIISKLAALIDLKQVRTPTVGASGSIEQMRSITGLAQMLGVAQAYPFTVGSSIFHPSDPVRLFERDGTSGQWFYGFSGFGSQFTRRRDASGDSRLTIVCEDVLRIFRYGRISFQPGISDQNAAKQIDAQMRTFLQDGLTGLTLPEYIYALVYGPSSLGASRTTNQPITAPQYNATQAPLLSRRGVHAPYATTEPLATDAIGAFNKRASVVGYLGSGSTTIPLSEFTYAGLTNSAEVTGVASPSDWQDRVDHVVRLSDLNYFVVDEKKDVVTDYEQACLRNVVGPDGNTYQTIDYEAVVNTIGRYPQWFPVDRGGLYQLYPGSLGPNLSREVLVKTLTQGPAFSTEWKTRLAVMYDVVERVDHSFYATPKGDLVVEMPLYDEDPQAFSGVLDNTADVSTTKTLYGSRYTFNLEDITSIDDSLAEDKITSLVLAYPYVISQNPELGTAETVVASQPQIAFSDSLIAQYGVRMQKLPGKHFIDTGEGANLYAHIMLNRMNAEAWTMNVGVVPRLGIGPNRPIYFEDPCAVGATRNVTRTVSFGRSGNYTMSINTNRTRRWHGLRGDDGAPIFSAVGGLATYPLNYAVLLNGRSAQAQISAPTPATPEAEVVPLQATARRTPAGAGQMFDPAAGADEADTTASDGEAYIRRIITPAIREAELNVRTIATAVQPGGLYAEFIETAINDQAELIAVLNAVRATRFGRYFVFRVDSQKLITIVVSATAARDAIAASLAGG